MATSLIVPIDVQALAIGSQDTTVQVLPNYADFGALPYVLNNQTYNPDSPYLSNAVLQNSTPLQGTYPYPVGIHVHWALPAALSQGSQASPTSQVSFPAVPNRWLLFRIVTKIGNPSAMPVATMGWVVESDLLYEQAPAGSGLHTPTAPLQPASNQQTWAYLGQSFPLAQWTPALGIRLTPFTAVGPGEATFASFYPNCCTSLGFCDTLQDFDAYDPTLHQIAYVVCGWYSDATSDPLAGGSISGSGNDLGWNFTTGANPTQTILSGSVAQVVWNASGQNVPQTAPGSLDVAIGPTLTEALSAALAGSVSSADSSFQDAQAALNALQCGVMPWTGQVTDALASIDETVHAYGFHYTSGGSFWTATPLTINGSQQTPALPQTLAASLASLNVLQAASDAAVQLLTSLQSQLYQCWNAFENSTYYGPLNPSDFPVSPSNLQGLLQYLSKGIQTQNTAVTSAAAAVTSAQQTLAPQMTAAGFSLQQTDGAPRFWVPLDPALVLSGAAVSQVTRYTSTWQIACRLDSELIGQASFAAGAVSGSSALTITSSQLPWIQLGALPGAASMPAQVLQGVLADALMSVPSLIPVALAAGSQNAPSDNPVALNPAQALAAYQAGLTALANQTQASVTFGAAVAPDPSGMVTFTSAPWLPILMQYSVEFTATAPLLNPSQISSTLPTYSSTMLSGGDYSLTSDEVDLVYAGSITGTAVPFVGQGILSSGVQNNLAAAVDALIAQGQDADPDLPAVKAAILQSPIVGQGLPGFTAAMLMQDAVLQVPVYDPQIATSNPTFLSSVATCVGSQNTVAPLPEDDFNPIRSGLLSLQQIRIVDAFGRFLDFTDTLNVTVAAAFTPPAQLQAPAGTAYLPPRFSQPSRLLFNWLGADGSTIDPASPAESPIAGFLVLNLVDQSLDLYTSGGAAVMNISLLGETGSQTVQVSPPPLSPLGTSATFSQMTASIDADLAAFAAAVSGQSNNGNGAYLAAILNSIQIGLESVLPASLQENPALAAFAGQPLALARAGLSLQLMGGPAQNQSWSALNGQIYGTASGLDGGVSQMDIPVMLGNVTQLNDSLLGYFVSGDLQQFYSVASVTASSGVVNAGYTSVSVTPQAKQLPLLLLLDPRGEVNATTGLLPVSTIQLPQTLYANALAGISIAFRVGALLTGSNTGGVGMPLPVQSVGTWNWASVQNSEWVSTVPADTSLLSTSLSYTPQSVTDGWLVLNPSPDTN